MHNAVDHLVEAYGLGSGPWTLTPVTRGALGQIWKLSGHSSTWAVKEMLFGCDERQVQREAALRDASERLGITSPKLLANREGSPVSRLPPRAGGSSVKLYEWIDGTGADPARPEILSWVGRTLALLHVAGAGTSEAPGSWYETCPRKADWEELHRRTDAAGLPWSDALARFAAGPAGELARLVNSADRSALVTSHLDVQPQNVLLGPAGPVLIDWDNAGPTAPERELAWIVFAWSGRNRLNADSARRVVRAYVAAGGPGRIRDLDAFSTLVATSLNYIQVQAEAAVDPAKTVEQREFGKTEVARSLRSLPEPAVLGRLIKELEPEWP
ncbi:phosphotransferase enzyme family protein [Streptomyces guryensis]|uniref:Aminoglycoside phosphotransferase family protein n=1 Tax=Streptomyces guryensis TaxID=2886947 RepID=A0A9Q3VK34_9ACTN|nr:aminoglycoside phosphotransferase family protein [Streptomyces guryensis]MCD9873197.1 aminoglycoside phosphotransferase family protein [Streptomyces guryensis]